MPLHAGLNRRARHSLDRRRRNADGSLWCRRRGECDGSEPGTLRHGGPATAKALTGSVVEIALRDDLHGEHRSVNASNKIPDFVRNTYRKCRWFFPI